MRSNPAVTSMVIVNTGSEFESKKEAGIAHFLEHMLFKGTKKRPKGIDISRELDQIGANYNAFTSREHTAYHIKSAKIHFEKITEVLADMVFHSLLRDVDVDRERGVILEEINMYHDLPQEVVAEEFLSLLYGDQPAGREILGTKETVGSFTGKDLRAFKKKHYIPEKMVIVVAGGVSHERAKKYVQELFVDIAPGKNSKKTKVRTFNPRPRVKALYKKTDQTHFVLGGLSCDRYSKDSWVVAVLAAVLDGGMSGRIFQRIREEMGAAYYASFGPSLYTDHGYWTLSAGVTNARIVEVLEASLQELERITSEPVSKEELKKAKDYLIGSLLLSLETSGSRARFYGFQSLYKEKPIRTPDELSKKIQKVTSTDLLRVAKKYLAKSNMRLAIIGPLRDSKRFEKMLSS